MATATEVRERPILFSGPMVRAIRDGRKTQTRRIVKPQPPEGHGIARCPYTGTGWSFEHPDGGCYCKSLVNPYGHPGFLDSEPGDRLWVRETWAANAMRNLRKPAELKGETIYYRATYDNDSHFMWRPSIHMPRWASRILLEITGVRVERLNDISPEDAEAEGVEQRWTCVNPATGSYAHDNHVVDDYRVLWESINGPGSWDANPWVWAITFRVLES